MVAQVPFIEKTFSCFVLFIGWLLTAHINLSAAHSAYTSIEPDFTLLSLKPRISTVVVVVVAMEYQFRQQT